MRIASEKTGQTAPAILEPGAVGAANLPFRAPR